MPESHRLRRRLRPLYLASFLQGFMLWYATEKLFMRSIGFDDAQIAIAGILISATMVLFQIPSGILADRWSRKGVLILGNTVLMLTTLVGVLSQDVTTYYITSALWGLYAAINLGTYDAVVYDTLEEETGNSQGFERYYGRVNLAYSLAVGAGALLSGVVAKFFGLRATFWISLPLIALAIAALLKFREPTVHRNQAKASLLTHTSQTLRAVMHTGALIWILIPLIVYTMLERIIDNLSPLWYLSFALPVIFWGPAYALLQASFGLAGPVADFVKNSRFKIGFLAFFISLVSIVLVSDVSVMAVLIAQTVILTGYGVFMILLSHQLHDALPSHVRAGASSTVGTLAQLIFLPTVYLFGWLSDTYTVFRAAWVIVAVTVLATLLFCLKVLPRKNTFAVDDKDIADAETYLR